MKRKILSVILTLAMVLSTFSMALAVPQDVMGTDFEDAVVRLVGLGVLSGYPDGSFRPNNDITRAEYASAVTRAKELGQEVANSQGTTVFDDVPANHWASAYVNVAEEEGLIAGYGLVNGVNNFKPELNITYEAAIAIILRALGYEPAVIENGGWPNGYLVVADEVGLLEDVDGTLGMFASRGLVAQLTYNALEIPNMIRVGSDYIVSGTQGTDEVYLFNELHMINEAADTGNWGDIDEDTFAQAGITGVTAGNLDNFKDALEALADGDNQNWLPGEIQGVFDDLVIGAQAMEVTYIDSNNIAIDNVVYAFDSGSILYDESGTVVATGGSGINVLIDRGDVVEDLVAESGVITSIKLKRDASVEAAAVLALPLTTDNEVQAARTAYSELTPGGKLEADAIAALANIEAAEAAIVDAQILALPALSTPPTAQEIEDVEDVRAAYEDLTANAKTLVVGANLIILQGYEATIAGHEVKAMIAALPNPANTATLADKGDMLAAKAAYDALSPAAKAVVDAPDPGEDKAHLTAVENRIGVLEAEALTIANAKAALTTLPFTVAKNLPAPVISSGPITPLTTETYAFDPVGSAATTPASLTGGGGAVITAANATITRDTGQPFTFKINVIITAGSTSETVEFTVTVPTGTSDVTMVKTQ